MEKTAFKIAIKFDRIKTDEPLQPIQFVEVKGWTIGNWGLVRYRKLYRIYHTQKGLILSYLYFEWENAVKVLLLACEIFGENHNGERSSENHKLSKKWEAEAEKLAFIFNEDDGTF